MRTAAIVLAAGKSERMGRNKLLLKLGQKTLIDIILDALEDSKIGEIVVVLGHKSEEIMDAINHRLSRVKVVVNERYEEGMTSSFKTGLKQTGSVDATFLILGDEPILDWKFLNAMEEEMEKRQDEASIISPIYKGKKGHPILFHRRLFEEILGLKDKEVMRDVIHRHIGQLLTVEAPQWTIMDIDTPDDFARMSRFVKNR
ncbi:hypothetical protein A2W24_03715 [Microgenomates group bacterium RBG_16_45_19]|nr:MAG: hypothetical protein A2W24_03715 [Microgenomates group bacterium RBG_16_45_19]